MSQITTRKVSEELASNETLLYIQSLEAETERLKKQVRDVAANLHTCKVRPSLLSRLFKAQRFTLFLPGRQRLSHSQDRADG